MKINIHLYSFVIFIRLFAIVLIFFFPLEGIVINGILDHLDGYFWVYAGLNKQQYHEVDKPLDYLGFVAELLVVANTEIAIPALILFLFRTVGHVLYRFTRNSKMFVFFPNFFESFVTLYIIFERFNLNISIFDWRILLFLLVFKIFHEIYIHYFPIDVPYNVFGKLLQPSRGIKVTASKGNGLFNIKNK